MREEIEQLEQMRDEYMKKNTEQVSHTTEYMKKNTEQVSHTT